MLQTVIVRVCLKIAILILIKKGRMEQNLLLTDPLYHCQEVSRKVNSSCSYINIEKNILLHSVRFFTLYMYIRRIEWMGLLGYLFLVRVNMKDQPFLSFPPSNFHPFPNLSIRSSRSKGSVKMCLKRAVIWWWKSLINTFIFSNIFSPLDLPLTEAEAAAAHAAGSSSSNRLGLACFLRDMFFILRNERNKIGF